MNFFKNIKIKKQFEQLLKNAEFLHNETKMCLHPANKVFWEFHLKAISSISSKMVHEIEVSLTTMMNYIDQICKLENQITEIYENNRQLLHKHDSTYEEIMKGLQNIQTSLICLEQNFMDIPDHGDYPEIKTILSNLDKVNRKLYLINKYRPQDIISIEQ